MKKINLENMSKNELMELNHEVVERIRMLQSLENSKKTAQFKVGDAVKFESRKKKTWVYGKIKKINRKTIDIKTDDFSSVWRVSATMVNHQ